MKQFLSSINIFCYFHYVDKTLFWNIEKYLASRSRRLYSWNAIIRVPCGKYRGV